MRILWDLRLFSHGYCDRGVGAYVRAMAREIGKKGVAHHIVAWANKYDIPAEVAALPAAWIPYGGGSWKSDLVRIPLLAARNNIDVIHYWVAMGPVFRIGMGLFPGCRTLATVYDLGVEFNRDDPYCVHARGTWYWRFQKFMLRRADAIACISHKTSEEVGRLLKGIDKKTGVFYPPIEAGVASVKRREDVFVTLAGAPHKNLARTVEAFSLFRKTHGSFRLVILGEMGRDDVPGGLPDGVSAEPMGEYHSRLVSSTGLIMCSTYEGLGIPPLEAMAHHCPMVLSDIAPFRETCDGAARFANARDMVSMAEAMADVADNRDAWAEKSARGHAKYRAMSEGAGGAWDALYEALAPAPLDAACRTGKEGG
jgi:glycosyltransferase involved in cell wall biosynthesis